MWTPLQTTLLLSSSNLHLTQHVTVPTHKKGHIRDLIITDTAPIKNLQVYDLGMSDHKVISLELHTPTLKENMKFGSGI